MTHVKRSEIRWKKPLTPFGSNAFDRSTACILPKKRLNQDNNKNHHGYTTMYVLYYVIVSAWRTIFSFCMGFFFPLPIIMRVRAVRWIVRSINMGSNPVPTRMKLSSDKPVKTITKVKLLWKTVRYYARLKRRIRWSYCYWDYLCFGWKYENVCEHNDGPATNARTGTTSVVKHCFKHSHVASPYRVSQMKCVFFAKITVIGARS